jgi:ribosomal protein S18 acetylase RimI-like enzyme
MSTSAHSATIVRDARDDERAAIRALTLRAYEEIATVMAPSAWAGLERVLHERLDAEGGFSRIVAERAVALVGSVQLYPPESDAYGGEVAPARWPEVRLLAVDPEARGLGIARRLMDECIRRARAMGASEIGLHTSESLRDAVRLYERMGFVRVPANDFHPEGGELVRAYRLSIGGTVA